MLYKKSNTGKIRCNYRQDCYNETDVKSVNVKGGKGYVTGEDRASGSDRKYCGI